MLTVQPQREGEWKKIEESLGWWRFKRSLHAAQHREVHDKSVVFVMRTGWLVYFIFKIAHLVSFIKTDLMGISHRECQAASGCWNPGESLTVRVLDQPAKMWTAKESRAQTDGFPRMGASQKPCLLPRDLGSWPPVPAGGSFSAPSLQRRHIH